MGTGKPEKEMSCDVIVKEPNFEKYSHFLKSDLESLGMQFALILDIFIPIPTFLV